MFNLAVFGSPGAGKGTQAKLLSEKLNIPHISTGDLFRQNIEAETELGKTAQRFIKAGELVPTEITNQMVEQRLKEDDAKNGFILDGYPRSLIQSMKLSEILGEKELNKVLYFDIEQNKVVDRMLERGRADDTRDVIENRLKIYDEQLRPILEYYKDIVVNIPADDDIETVFKNILKALNLD